MSNKISQALLELAETDKQITALAIEKGSIEEVQNTLLSDIERHKLSLEKAEMLLQEQSSRKVEEEDKLRNEQARIVEQRKQLTSIGGVKSAKLVERQIDIASRTLQAMEERASKATEEVGSLESRAEALREALESLEGNLNEQKPDQDKSLSALEKEIQSFTKHRDNEIGKLDDRLQRLYTRVSSRYPSGAVSVAKKGACRSCFRFLPAQTYNQIIAGNLLIQCPGCSRIVVYGGDEPVAEEEEKPKKKTRAKAATKKTTKTATKAATKTATAKKKKAAKK